MTLDGHLSPIIPSLMTINLAIDVMLMAKVVEEASYVPHHEKK